MKSQNIKIITVVVLLSMLVSTFAYALGDITLKINVSDDGSGVSKIILPDGTEIEGEFSEYVITENGEYTFIAYDKAGNMTEEKYIVEDIDEDYPALIIDNYETFWTNQDITVTARAERGELEKDRHTFVKNSTFTFVALSDRGNNRVEKKVTINNIDKTKPNLNLQYKDKTLIIAEAIDQESGIDKIILPDGSEVNNDSAIFETNGDGAYTFKVYDIAGNESIRTAFVIKDELIEIPDLDENSNLTDIEKDIDKVQDKIDSLEEGELKEQLQEELDKLKNSFDEEVKRRIEEIDQDINNMVSIEEGESIENKINNLPNSYKTNKYLPPLNEEKDRLNIKLENKIEEIFYNNDLQIATNAVELAEKTKKENDLDDARKKVNKKDNEGNYLLSENHREVLNERLDLVEEYINYIKDIEKDIDNLTTSEDKDRIQSKIDELEDGSDKDRLQNKLNDKIKELEKEEEISGYLAEATKAVEKAEKSIKQNDVDSAWSKVEKLEEGQDRNLLSERLERVQEQIEAIKQINKDIDNMTDPKDKDKIQDQINKLPDSEEKDNLQDKLDDKAESLENNITNNKAYQEALMAVIKAERTKEQLDVDIARVLVSVLDEGKDKDLLNARLDAIQRTIDKEEDDKKEEDKIKDKDLQEATKAVERAETTKQQSDIDYARILVNKLPRGRDRTTLLERLDRIQKQINKDEVNDQNKLDNAIEAVEKAEESIKQKDVDTARILVSDLKDSIEKSMLNLRLDQVQRLIDKYGEGNKENLPKDTLLEEAIKAVEKAEKSLNQRDVDLGKIRVEYVKNEKESIKLIERLEVVQAQIDKLNLENAIEAVSKTEITKNQNDLNSARVLVNLIKAGKERDNLNSRLDKVQKTIDALNKPSTPPTNSGTNSKNKPSTPPANNNNRPAPPTNNNQVKPGINSNNNNNNDTILNNDFELEGEFLEDSFSDKPTRGKQNRLFKLKEPTLAEEEDNNIEEKEQIDKEDNQDSNSEETGKSKGLLKMFFGGGTLATILGGAFFFLTKRKLG